MPVTDNAEGTGGYGKPPPIDEAILEGPPGTTWTNFKHARLRQFPRCGLKIDLQECLGRGEEGIVFKAAIGDLDPVVVKVFWRTQRPKPYLPAMDIGFLNGLLRMNPAPPR
ncbi:hypothetical protein B7463_g10922, partial [Scytalidium lignicola]